MRQKTKKNHNQDEEGGLKLGTFPPKKTYELMK